MRDKVPWPVKVMALSGTPGASDECMIYLSGFISPQFCCGEVYQVVYRTGEKHNGKKDRKFVCRESKYGEGT